jgi:phosphoribosylamine--glycine ligase
VKVLVVGSGGREHALAWKLSASPELEELHAAPGNPGIAELGPCHPVRPEDADGLLALARELDTDLVVIGPEAPLVRGVADRLRRGGVAVFGPSAAAARIEGSKSFAKQLMVEAGVPTAGALAIARPPCVVKVDGLAAGKGVFVCHTQEELDAALQVLRGGPLVIEELLEGQELSVFALCDGLRAVGLAVARDYKRVGDGDTGPNTGGMGAYSPVDGFGTDEVEEILELVHRPVLAALAARGAPFAGLLYAGLILTPEGPRVLEFNCRFGDPETQAVLPRLEDDLLTGLAAAAAGNATGVSLAASDETVVNVVLTASAYPEHGDAGTPIEGVDEARATGALVFQAGTALQGSTLVTNGGRILNVAASGGTVAEARTRAYAAIAKISFEGMRYRHDIAVDA